MSQEATPTKTSLTVRETELAVVALQALKNGKVEVSLTSPPAALLARHVTLAMDFIQFPPMLIYSLPYNSWTMPNLRRWLAIRHSIRPKSASQT